MLTKKYRIKEIQLDNKTIFYPEYSYKLFPFYWTRLEYNIWLKSDKKAALIYFTDLQNATFWLKKYIEETEPQTKIHNI
jgi:hypothetical protein